MTSNASAPPGVATGTGAASFARYGLAASAVAFPVVFLVAFLLTIGDVSLEGREYVQHIADNLDSYAAPLWLWPFATILGVPALLAVGRVARSRAPALGLAGLVLGFGFVIAVGIDPGEVIYAALKAGLDVDTTTALVESVENNVPSSILGFGWFVGLLGLVLLGVAVLRGRSAPSWAAICLIVAPVAIPLTFFAGVGAALIAAWAVLGAGFVGCALTLFKEPEQMVAPSN